MDIEGAPLGDDAGEGDGSDFGGLDFDGVLV
jgi:hypothetical protein